MYLSDASLLALVMNAVTGGGSVGNIIRRIINITARYRLYYNNISIVFITTSYIKYPLIDTKRTTHRSIYALTGTHLKMQVASCVIRLFLIIFGVSASKITTLK